MYSVVNKIVQKAAHRNRSVVKEAIENNPEQLIGIKSNRVYSQIARTGRNPQKSTEQAILISALEHASEVKRINGETVRINPVYVPMKAKEIQLCFGRRIEQMPDSSFFVFEKEPKANLSLLNQE